MFTCSGGAESGVTCVHHLPMAFPENGGGAAGGPAGGASGGPTAEVEGGFAGATL